MSELCGKHIKILLGLFYSYVIVTFINPDASNKFLMSLFIIVPVTTF